MHAFILSLEILGTVAFAVSGAMIALKKKMDIFGVVTLGLITSIGGGILRDLLLGITPPTTFKNPTYAITAIITSFILFIPVVRKWLLHKNNIYEKVLFTMDTIGLGLFTVMGIRIAYDTSTEFSSYLYVLVGVLTGVGGGVMRDILAGNTPFIFVKHIYACASILGSLVCYLLWNYVDNTYAMFIGAVIVMIVRGLSAHYKLNLPRAKDFDESSES